MKIDYSERMVIWEWDGCVIKIELSDIIHAEYNKDENIVIVYSGENFVSKIISIFRSSSDFDVPSELEVYNLEGEKIDQIESPAGFTMLYISEISKKKLGIVCEALKEDCFDKSGRRDFYFNLELETRKWVKDGIAY